MNRRKTRVVPVGNVLVGGDNPIRIQSMTTSDTKDVAKTVEQIKKLSDAGCEIVRVTVQGIKEAQSCELIKNELIISGYDVPLVADIHFFPKAALFVADFVDKVRMNPGNYIDPRATFIQKEYDDASYQLEIEKIEEKFTPLVLKLKALNKSLRIGTNHGSLSDRIMNRYGDTPLGMVMSAIEFTHVCRKHDFHNIIYSMKASNPVVMIEAYRLLVKHFDELGWDYPLHLGVTEAGAGDDGRIKSAIGIGSLLLEGIGDTIRISLTEDPWEEIDPCKRLIRLTPPVKKPPQMTTKKRERFLHRDGCVVLSKEGLGVDGFFQNGLIKAASKDYEVIEAEGEFEITDKPVIYRGSYANARSFFKWLDHRVPALLGFRYNGEKEDVILQAAAECGSLLIDGLADGLCIETPYDFEFEKKLSFTILQGARMRLTKTEFISCPGCGRTLFELQSVAARIRQKTAHLPGVKIAIMGCIVNGPGEMADADFGYVGSKPGKIDLYVGKTCVEKNIDFADADNKLIDLLKAHGKWIEA